MTILSFVVSAVIAYLLGSISFSVVITEKFAGIDVRKKGSGNAGATNVLRTAGKLPGILTFVCDFLKCIAAILLANLVFIAFSMDSSYLQYIKYTAGIFCMLGHIWPLYFGFKGGKGVTVAAAAVLMLDWRCFIIGIGIFIIMVLITRIVSLSSLIAAASVPVSMLILYLAFHRENAIAYVLLGTVIVAIIFVKHRANIVRLIKGEEPRIKSGHIKRKE
jgi:glycerol-3-phosphate acyltransferase PlsY